MGKFRKIPIVIEATQWFKYGDHPEDDCKVIDTDEGTNFFSEGKTVRYYRDPNNENRRCNECNNIMNIHGWIDTLEGGHIVCPGDWIITGVKGEKYPIKNDIFKMTYEPVPEG